MMHEAPGMVPCTIAQHLFEHVSGGAYLLPTFTPISFFRRVSRFGVSGHLALQQGNPCVSWNAALSCPLMPSNYANLYLVLISFRSRSGVDHSLDILGW